MMTQDQIDAVLQELGDALDDADEQLDHDGNQTSQPALGKIPLSEANRNLFRDARARVAAQIEAEREHRRPIWRAEGRANYRSKRPPRGSRFALTTTMTISPLSMPRTLKNGKGECIEIGREPGAERPRRPSASTPTYRAIRRKRRLSTSGHSGGNVNEGAENDSVARLVRQGIRLSGPGATSLNCRRRLT